MKKIYLLFLVIIITSGHFLVAQCPNYVWAQWTDKGTTDTAKTFLNANGEIISMTMSTNYPFFFSPDIFNYPAFNTFPDPPPNTTVPATTWGSGPGGTTTMCFSKPVTNPVLLLSSLGNPGVIVTLTFSLPYVVIFDGGGMLYPDNLTITGQEGNAIIMFPGTFTCVTIFSSTPEHYSNITWGIKTPPIINVNNASVCLGNSAVIKASGAANYTWNPGAITGDSIIVTPSITTTYTVTGTTVAGCSASNTATITVNPNPIITVPAATICEGASATLTANGATTYTWSPATGLSTTTGTSVIATPAATITYTVTGSNPTGCTGTVEVIVTVNPIPAIVVPNASICQGGSTTLTASGATTYVWSPATGLSGTTGTTVTANPAVTSTYTVCGTSNNCSSCTTVVVTVGALIADAGPDKFICSGSSTTLNASGGNLFTWTPATGLSSTSVSNPTASPSVTTTYTVVVSNGSCSDDDVVVVTVDPPISLNVAGIDVSCFGACNGQTIVIPSGGSGTFIYSWNNGCTTAACNNICAGTYTLTATDGAGCTASGTATVNQPPLLTVAIAGRTDVSCYGLCDGTANVSANGGTTPYNYLWTSGGGNTATANGLCIGTYTCTIIDANNCSVKTSVIITQPAKVVVTISGITTICAGQSTTLTTNTGSTYSWSNGETTKTITVTPGNTATYSVSVTQNGCIGTNSITVNVVSPITANVSGNDICEGESTILKASGGSSYLWSTTETINPIIVSPASTTTYTVIVTAGSCTDTATYVVKVIPLPTVTATGNATISYGNSTPLTATGGGNYNWNPSTGLSCTNCSNPIATPTATTQYCVTVTMNGCSDSACVTITIDTKCGFEGDLYVPNGFSPNGDGQNDVLYVRGGGITGIYLSIYDRWGERVFETTDPKHGWDGTYKDKQLDPAVFVYYLKVNCFSGEEITQKGNVAIIK